MCFSASHEHRYEAAGDLEFAHIKCLSKGEVPTWTSEAKKVKANHRCLKSTGNTNRLKKYLTAVPRQQPLHSFHFIYPPQAGAVLKSRHGQALQTLHPLKLVFHRVSWNTSSACSETLQDLAPVWQLATKAIPQLKSSLTANVTNPVS